MNLFPENISTYGKEMDDIFFLICIPVFIAFIITLIVMIYPLFRYRKKEGRRAKYIKGVGMGQLKWIVIPMTLLAIADFYILFAEHPIWNSIEETLPPADLHVAVTGQQWSWTITYPGPDDSLNTADDVMVTNELHVPVNKVTHVDIRALDVLHSFFLPNVRLKQDALPGRTITRWFEPSVTGEYDIACAEICGIGHAKMRGTLTVETEEQFRKYLEGLYNKNNE